MTIAEAARGLPLPAAIARFFYSPRPPIGGEGQGEGVDRTGLAPAEELRGYFYWNFAAVSPLTPALSPLSGGEGEE